MLAALGEHTPFDKMRNFLGTPVRPPQKIALAVTGERTRLDKKRNFLGAPVKAQKKRAYRSG